MFELEGKTCVVTGGGRGIGRGIVRAMARAGANVVVTGRTLEPLEASATEARDLGVEALVVQSDITIAEDVAKIVDQTIETFGYIDCWVNNAGSARRQDVGPLINLTEEQWDAVVDLNMKWTFFAAQAAARAMTRGGSIINISSRSGSQPNPNTGQYGAAKAGVENLTGTMAVEWGHLGIRVNAVAPGIIMLEEHKSRVLDNKRKLQRQIDVVPLRRLGEVDDVGPLCVYLASDESGYLTGAVIPVHGGSRVTVGYLSYLHHVSERMAEAEGATAASE